MCLIVYALGVLNFSLEGKQFWQRHGIGLLQINCHQLLQPRRTGKVYLNGNLKNLHESNILTNKILFHLRLFLITHNQTNFVKLLRNEMFLFIFLPNVYTAYPICMCLESGRFTDKRVKLYKSCS